MINQSYNIYLDGGEIVVRGAIDAEIAHRGTCLAEAVGRAQSLRADDCPGSELKLAPGLFPIGKPIVLQSGTALVGSGFASVIKQTDDFEGRAVLLAESAQDLSVENLSVEGNTAEGNGSGLILSDCGGSFIRRVYSRDFEDYGIALQNHCYGVSVQDCRTSKNRTAGFLIKDAENEATGGQFVPNNLYNCYSYRDMGDGIRFDHAVCQNIVGCCVYMAGKDGIHMHESTSNLTTGCRVFLCDGNGVTYKDSFEINLSANIIGWNHGHNVDADHSVWGCIVGNEFIDAGGRVARKHGIYLHNDCRALQVSGNSIFNWYQNEVMDCGIFESADCRENNINDNCINYYEHDGVRARGYGSTASMNLNIRHAYDFLVVTDSHGTPPVPVPDSYETVPTRDDVTGFIERAEAYLASTRHEL